MSVGTIFVVGCAIIIGAIVLAGEISLRKKLAELNRKYAERGVTL